MEEVVDDLCSWEIKDLCVAIMLGFFVYKIKSL